MYTPQKCNVSRHVT